MSKVGKYCRGVSIIGVGCTPFTNTLKNPETMGLTESELLVTRPLRPWRMRGSVPR